MTPIKSINLIDEKISIIFDTHWFQEGIHELSLQLLNKIQSYDIKDITQGADRESCRFIWLNAEFSLHFDYYSQSCWFSAHDEMSTSKIQSLFKLLTEKSS